MRTCFDNGQNPRTIARKNLPGDKDLRRRMLEFAPDEGSPMEAEQLNQIANALADLKARAAEMRRLL
jgi:hypothetical protein